MSVNKVILVGNLGADPDMRYTGSGQAVCELRIATEESWTGKDGQRNAKTEWHRVVVWGNTGEACAKHLAKGRQVYVEGRIQTRSYDDKDGQKRYVTEIIASDVKFLGGGDRSSNGRSDNTRRGGASEDEDWGYGASGDADIPL